MAHLYYLMVLHAVPYIAIFVLVHGERAHLNQDNFRLMHDHFNQDDFAMRHITACNNRVPANSTIAGYTVGRCLGAGSFGEVYLVTKDGVERVLKVGEDLDEGECQYAREMSELAPTHFVNCTDYGPYARPGTAESNERFMVLEKARGQELYKLLAKDQAPPQLDSLLKVLNALKQYLHILEVMATPDVRSSHSHFLADMHLNNIFMDRDGNITIIDYGMHCMGSFQQCEKWGDRPGLQCRFEWNLRPWDTFMLMLVGSDKSGKFPYYDQCPHYEQAFFGQIPILMSGGQIDQAKSEDVSQKAVEEVKHVMRDTFKLRPGKADDKFSALLKHAFQATQQQTTLSEPQSFPWACIDSLSRALEENA